ncbi:MAG TPA: hypothetical protein VGI26_04305 [Solirubrobacteraceae bacterium]
MPPPILAHLGHWYVSLPVFMGPVLLLVLALKVQTWRERRPRAKASGRRSTVTATNDGSKTMIAVAGVLDYPTVLEVEIELGEATRLAGGVVLDLRACTSVDQESAWCLCDALGRIPASDEVLVLLDDGDSMRVLSDALAAEGVKAVLRERGARPHERVLRDK